MLKNKIILIIFLVLALILTAFGAFIVFKKLNKQAPIHTCSPDGFIKTISPGGKISFSVNLSPTGIIKKYRVRLGDLPAGITGQISKTEGRGAGNVSVTLSAEEGAEPASYNLVIVYEEEKESSKYETSYCQFNLKVE